MTSRISKMPWRRAYDTCGGTVYRAEYKNCALVMRFFICISDVWRDRHSQLMDTHNCDKECILKATRYEGKKHLSPSGAGQAATGWKSAMAGTSGAISILKLASGGKFMN